MEGHYVVWARDLKLGKVSELEQIAFGRTWFYSRGI